MMVFDVLAKMILLIALETFDTVLDYVSVPKSDVLVFTRFKVFAFTAV